MSPQAPRSSPKAVESTLGLQLCAVLPTLPWHSSPLPHSILMFCQGLGTQVRDILCSMPTVCPLLHPLHLAAHSHPVGLRVPTAEPWNSRVSGDLQWGVEGCCDFQVHTSQHPTRLLARQEGYRWKGACRSRVLQSAGPGQGTFMGKVGPLKNYFFKSGPFGTAARWQKMLLILQCVCMCFQLLSCVRLCDPMGCRPSGSSAHGILWARILEWVAISSSTGSCQPREQTHISDVSCNAGGFFTTESLGRLPDSPEVK